MNESDTKIIAEAIEQNDLNKVREMLEKDPSLANSVHDLDPLINCIPSVTNFEMLQLLVEYGADVNSKSEVLGFVGETPLHDVCRGNINSVHFLLENHADINAESDEGLTPLMVACVYNRPEIVRCLLENGTDFVLEDYTNGTVKNLIDESGYGRFCVGVGVGVIDGEDFSDEVLRLLTEEHQKREKKGQNN